MREGAAAVPKQQTFTKDNVVVYIEGTLFMKVVDSYKSCYAIDQPLQSLTIAAQALVRAQVPPTPWAVSVHGLTAEFSVRWLTGLIQLRRLVP